MVWYNPKFPTPPQPTPPTDDTRPLVTLARGDAELRVGLARYQGWRFVSFRIWNKGSDGQYWPTKKAVSVRLREIEDVIAALRSVEGLIDDEDARQDEPPVRPYDGRSGVQHERDGEERPGYVRRRGRPQPRSFEGESIATPRHEFNEFD